MRKLLLLGVVLTVLLPSTASAAVPCRDKIYNDWYHDGKVATTYPISCYRDAIDHVQADAAVYSSLVDDIKSAMQGALDRRHGEKKANVPAQIGRGLSSSATGAVKGKTITLAAGGTVSPNQPVRETTTVSPPPPGDTSTVASGDTTGGGSGVPTPIIVLGALAILLAAAGAAGGGLRWFKRRG